MSTKGNPRMGEGYSVVILLIFGGGWYGLGR